MQAARQYPSVDCDLIEAAYNDPESGLSDWYGKAVKEREQILKTSQSESAESEEADEDKDEAAAVEGAY